MKCSIGNCEKEATRRKKTLCEMHYYRMRRTGSYEVMPRKRKYRRANPAGYQMLHIPDHPLVNNNGYVYEHRYVVYEKYGDMLPDCDLCGAKLTWSSCHIDHIDKDVTNNIPSNLRPLCQRCNMTWNATPYTERANTISLTYKGETKTAAAWSRDDRVNVSHNTILRRKHQGMSDEDALFSPKITHKNLS